MKFTINGEIFDRISPLRIGVLVLENINNRADIGEFVAKEYADVGRNIVSKFDGIELAEYPVIRKWRDIYKDFGEKKARSSIEALIRRTLNGNPPPSINPLVDIYNLASMKFEVPCGGENLDAMGTDMELTFATGNENFIPLGQTEPEHPNVGEVIYKFADTVICRNFNYRESDVTKLTHDTTRAIIVFEDVAEGVLETALDWVSKKATEFLNATVLKTTILTFENNSFFIGRA